MGKSSCGCYAVTLNPNNIDFLDRLNDFICYETSYNRSVLISVPDGHFDMLMINEQSDIENLIRPYDPAYLVHSTTLPSYEKIKKSEFLKSAALLNNEGIKTTAIGFTPLGEPSDYLDYVMFAPMEGFGSGSEMVVNSHLRGYACFNPDAEYIPQARMYFDTHKIISDGLAVRDGVHSIKILNKIPLHPYLVMVVFGNDILLPKHKSFWTPTLFNEKANEYFNQNLESADLK